MGLSTTKGNSMARRSYGTAVTVSGGGSWVEGRTPGRRLSEETDDSMLVFEDELEGGKVTPMHFHADVDEALYIIDGEITLNVEGEEHVVGAGGFTFAPRGCAHAFCVTSERARLLCIQTPGSGQDFYRNASRPATRSGTAPVDFDRIRKVAIETGATTIVGPPPFTTAQS